MTRYKSGKCGCKTRIVSNTVSNMNGRECFDVCVNPICGSPETLSLFAPVIYDQIGINLCTTLTLGVDWATEYPTATNAWVQVVDIAYAYGDGNVTIEQLTGRQNCYAVTLTNLTVQLAIYIYDAACRLLDIIYRSAVYLPSDTTAATFDEDTNPTSVELVIFAPYGVAYNENEGNFSPALNNIAFLSGDNYVRQGLNLYGYPKVLNLDVADDTLTVGLTLVLQSLYFAGYQVANGGKINTPKGSIVTPEDSECMRFVAGELLDLAIKPLDLGTPACEELLKKSCSTDCKEECNMSS